MNSTHRTYLGGLFIAALFALFTGAFLWLHWVTPSDGARLEPGQIAISSNGVIVTPLEDQPAGLRRNDLVIAVEGRPLESWASTGRDAESMRPIRPVGQSVTYTVIRDGKHMDVNVPLVQYPLGAILGKNWSTLLFTLFTQLVGTLVFMKKPGNHAARALFVWAWSLSHTYTWSIGLQVSDFVDGMGFWLYHLSATGAWHVFNSAGLLFALYISRSRSAVVKRRWFVVFLLTAPFLLYLVYLGISAATASSRLEWMSRWIPGDWLFAFVFLSLIVWVVADGYVNREPVERRQVRWLVFGFMLCGGAALSLWFLPGILLGHPIIDANAFGLILLPFPLILAIAILRDRLFDIDIIIRRTLIYSVLSALLALIYLGSVVVLQQFFRGVTGQASDIAIIVSTLAIAALFSPLRRGVQQAIDQRFYRRKYDVEQVLARFAVIARDEVELEKLSDELLAVVNETMQPASVSLWLRSPGGRNK
jgi:two-component system NarL family sensor kinase